MTTIRRKTLPLESDRNDDFINGQISTSSEAINANNHNTIVSYSNTTTLLPTPLETAFLLIYPLTIILGSLYAHVAPQVRSSTYDATSYSSSSPLFQPSSSDPTAIPSSYFAQKHNIFNLYFVKVGWFWTTVALGAFAATHPHFGSPLLALTTTTSSTDNHKAEKDQLPKQNLEQSSQPGPQWRRVQLFLRYAMATAWWIGVTRWFFGPALIDRSFRWTGGVCETGVKDKQGDAPGASLTSSSGLLHSEPYMAGGTLGDRLLIDALTAAQCKAAGGNWHGGHDLSGHVFMLCLSSAVLAFEVLPVLAVTRQRRRKAKDVHQQRPLSASHDPARPVAEAGNGGKTYSAEYLSTRFALAIGALKWWMLLMTAVFFHTWVEKFTGLAVAGLAVWSVYFLPRAFGRQVIGVPGA